MKNLVGNRWLNSSDNSTIDVISPESNQLIDRIPNSTVEDVNQIIELAELNQKTWEQTPLYKRAEILERFIENIEEDFENLTNLLSKESGRPIRETKLEINSLIRGTKLLIEQAIHSYDKAIPTGTSENLENVLQITKKVPLGIVVSILPFNSPIDSFVRTVISALIMGNAVVVKPSTKVPLTVITLVYLLVKSGVTIGAIGVINGDGVTTGQFLANNKKVDLIALTGTSNTGRTVLNITSMNMTKSLLNLSSNDSFIVLKDANIKLAAQEAAKSRLFNAGQNAFGAKKFFVHNEIKDQFIQELQKQINQINVGDLNNESTNIGYLINERHALKVEEQLKQLLQEGSKLILGGTRRRAYFEPTIVSDVDMSLSIFTNEILGPIFPIISFLDIKEIIENINLTESKSSTSIYTNNFNDLINISNSLEVGQISINKTFNMNSFELISGGVKNNSFGKEGITSSLEKMCETKIYAINTESM